VDLCRSLLMVAAAKGDRVGRQARHDLD
jgi:hypothetical protein